MTIEERGSIVYIHIGVGLSALLVSTDRAMREPLECGTGSRYGSHAFLFVNLSGGGQGNKILSIMSSFRTVRIECPKCKTTFPFTVYHSINVTLNPEFKEKILDLSLFTYHYSKSPKKD